MERYRKVICKLVGIVGLEGAYVFDALLNARNFQNTEEVVYTRPDAQRELFLERRPFERGIAALEEAGFISRIPASNPMRFVINDDVYMSKLTSSDESNMSKLTCEHVKTDMRTCQNRHVNMSKLTSSTIKRNIENTGELVESKNINNNQLEDLIRDYFQSKNKSREEADKFIRYNQQNYREGHLNQDNYQSLADAWIKNMKRKPKKAEDDSKPAYKTLKQYLEERGMTVEEYYGDKTEDKSAQQQNQEETEYVNEIWDAIVGAGQ